MKILHELSWLWETLGIALVAAAVDVYKRQGQGCCDEGVAEYILGIQSPEC